MPLSLIPDWARAAGAALGLIIASVFAGRLAWHADQVRRGHRRLWSREVLLELPTIGAMALLTWALVDYLTLSPGQAAGAGVVLGWLGPRGLEIVVVRVWRSRTSAVPPAPGAGTGAG
ncbi:phage holin family protein [Magnetospirillum molischianum]|uniref:LydA holin phage, holin superfamily III n=1 Tax=Magnetospirillum molischianum DSM 120 TaxID=1150626 RepID=H8FV08_MAGML|nr:phage holin family protein [Magnetospirillum molischianum]CCG42196.1 exported hypothetical protein [Magnetospirillum molischianum DSM 120]